VWESAVMQGYTMFMVAVTISITVMLCKIYCNELVAAKLLLGHKPPTCM